MEIGTQALIFGIVGSNLEKHRITTRKAWMNSNFDVQMLQRAVKLGHMSPPSAGALSVGALLVDRDGKILAEGYSRETSPHNHAEKEVIAKALNAGINFSDATLYSSIEPCGKRLSGRKSCAEWIIEVGIKRVVYSLDEPDIFVVQIGSEVLRESGVEVIVLTEFIDEVIATNSHIPGFANKATVDSA